MSLTTKLPPWVNIPQDPPTYPLLYSPPLNKKKRIRYRVKIFGSEIFMVFLTSSKSKNHHANLIRTEICFFAWSSLNIFYQKSLQILVITGVSRNTEFLGLLLMHVHIYSQGRHLRLSTLNEKGITININNENV